MKPASFAVNGFTGTRAFQRLFASGLVCLAVPLVPQTIQAQQGWGQNPQYANSQYVQPTPNYVGNPQSKPSPYGYQQAPDAQQQYAAPQQYGDQPQYGQQPQYQQPQYADPGYAGQGYAGQAQGDPNYGQQQQGAQPFVAQQLEQLVAPIALYPDSLVAQILAGSTYPAQIVAADNWLHSLGPASPDQIAYGADAQGNWDPSIKALTAFPQVLDQMNHDLGWTTDLGNAYYNQQQDVLQTIQILRQRAEAAGTLQSTPQEAVSYNQGYIQLAPVSSQVVYVPQYDPWSVYGQPVTPYPGFSLIGALQSIGGSNILRYGLSFAMSAFSHTPFGWAGWALNWLTSNVLFHQSPYYSQSTSVAHWGNGGGYYGNRGGGVNRTPNGFGRPEQSFNRYGNGYGSQGGGRPPVRTGDNYAYNRGGEVPARPYGGNNFVRPAVPNNGYGRPQAPVAQQVRPQTNYARPGGYGNGSYGGRPGGAYAGSYQGSYQGQQGYRNPAQSYPRNDLAQRSYAEPRSYGGHTFAESRNEGGSHMFGGGHEEHFKAPKAPRAPKAPKMSGGGGGGHHGGGLFGHHGR